MKEGFYTSPLGAMGPKVVCIGGGTGLSTLLRGLKFFTFNLTAVVTVADDGGGSGVLRDELDMPPPGDIRNCIQALANAEPIIEKLLAYRFSSGHLDGQSFGNLFLAAINGISSSFDAAVKTMGEALSITGRVLPVTNEKVWLEAEFEDGSKIVGESKICDAKAEKRCRIEHVRLIPGSATVLEDSKRAISEADMIVLGPGSLYTSVIPNLLVSGVTDAILKSNAIKVYVCNVMTQPGETEGYTAGDHISALFQHADGRLFDYCLINNSETPSEVIEKYRLDGAEPVKDDITDDSFLGVTAVRASVSSSHGSLARHDSGLLAKELIKLYIDKSDTKVYG